MLRVFCLLGWIVGLLLAITEFADELTGAGWESRTSKDGAVQIFSKDGAKYVFRTKNSSRYPGWTRAGVWRSSVRCC